MKDKTFIVLSATFFLLFAIATATLTLNNPLSQILRAKDVAPSPLKSFGVVFPQVGVSGATKIKVSIYIRDVNGGLLPNRAVKLSSDSEVVSITPSDTQNTNSIGQAEFFITSSESGKVNINAIDVATNTNVVNIPSVEFTQ